MTPARLRAWVVLSVVIAIILLTFGLYAAIYTLLREGGPENVPDALWLAAGAQAGVLGTLLVNSKGGQEGGVGAGGEPMTLTLPPAATMSVEASTGPAQPDEAADLDPGDDPSAPGPVADSATSRLRRPPPP